MTNVANYWSARNVCASYFLRGFSIAIFVGPFIIFCVDYGPGISWAYYLRGF
jgi:hypothetical protein